MNGKRFLFLILLTLTLSCNTVMRAFERATLTPLPALRLTAKPLPTPSAVATVLLPTALPTDELPPLGIAPPSYIPPACQNRPLATVPPATTVAEITPTSRPNASVPLDMQLRIFDLLVKRLQDSYLYPDFNGLDWPAVVAKHRAKLESGLEAEAFYAEMDSFIIELGDEHSRFESPAEVAASDVELTGENNYVGIGILIKPLPEKGRVTILAVFPNSAAEHGGIKPHDSILAVDGVPIAANGEAYPHRVRGPECSATVLTLQSPGEAPRNVTFVRSRIDDSTPVDARLVPAPNGSQIGYLFIPTFFNEKIPDQVEKALADFGELDGLIIDNRMNGGGSSTVVESILSLFTSGPVGRFVSRRSSRLLEVQPNAIHNSQTVPLVILVGEDTLSFGEIFSGALQDLERAKLVGQTTTGNVETLRSYIFEDGSRAWVAEERFDPLRSHADWEKEGIVPDVEAFADWDTFTFETDPAIAAAIKLFLRQP